MANRWLNLYHVTTFERAVRILDSKGISAEFSQGHRLVCWYVTKRLVPWAIAHTIHRHNAPMEQIAILRVKAEYSAVLRTGKNGVYVTSATLYPITMDGAEMWLSREEKYARFQVPRSNAKRWYGKEPE